MKKIRFTSNTFFLIFLYLNVTCKGMGLDNNNIVYFILLILGSVCLFVKFISDKYTKSDLDFLYALWLDDDRTLVDEFSTIIKDLVEYDFSIAEEQMKERLNIA